MSTLLSPSQQAVVLQDSGRFRGRSSDESLLLDDDLYQQLFNHTWNIYKATPLYHFRQDDSQLSYYSKCLDNYMNNEMRHESAWDSDEDEDSSEKVTGIRTQWNFKDSMEWGIKLLHIRIEYSKTSSKETKNSQTTPKSMCHVAFIYASDKEHPFVTMQQQFTRFPLLFIRGLSRLNRMLLDFFESHFDCRISHFRLQPVELSWLLFEWIPGMMGTREDVKSMKPLELTWSLPPSVPELRHIVITIPADGLQRLMRSMEGDVTATDVMDAIVSHLKDIFRLNVSRLHLIRIGTSMAYVGGPEAKLKLLDKAPIYGVPVLQTLCQLATQKFRL
jgi:hypothetical protein